MQGIKKINGQEVYLDSKRVKHGGNTSNDMLDKMLNGLQTYSTSEVNTYQKWIDGKYIYRKVIDLGGLPQTAGNKMVNHNIIGISEVVNLRAKYKNDGDNSWRSVPWADNALSGVVRVWATPTQIGISTNQTTGSTSYVYAIIEYTK